MKLAAFVDYKLTSIDEPVLVNLADKWVLQYNLAKDFNFDTNEKQDMVTITQLDEIGTTGLAGLAVRDSLEIADFNGSGETLRVTVCNSVVGTSTTPDVMFVSITMGDDSMCDKQDEPKRSILHPTMSPTFLYSIAPSAQPVDQSTSQSGLTTTIPNYVPNAMSTVSPTSQPIRVPSATPIDDSESFLWLSAKVATVSGSVAATMAALLFCLLK